MLFLKRIIHPTDFFRCDASGKILMYGDFYFEDDQTGKRIDAQYYHQLKEEQRENNWDYSVLNDAENQREYQEQLKELEREALSQSILNEKVFKWGD